MVSVSGCIQELIKFEKQHFRSLFSLHVLLFSCCFLMTMPANAILPQWWKDVHGNYTDANWHDCYTYTTSFFGPNALPVPEISDGRIPDKHIVEVSSDFFWGYGDQTQSITPRFTYTFIPGKLAVSGWGVLAEHYKTTIAVRDQRASLVEDAQQTLLIGDFYISTLMALCQEKKYCPDVILEFVLKTASSESPRSARFFDTPGYYFDLTTGKSFNFSHSYINELRFVGEIGFLSYQLNNGLQNDAPLFGGKMELFSEKWSLENGFGGYKGWLNKGDAPLVLRSRFNFLSGKQRYFFQYQHALRDYPFRRFQVGIDFEL